MRTNMADPGRGHGDLSLNDNTVPPILSEPGSAVAEGVHPIWIRTIGPALTTGSRLLPKGDAGPISRMGSFKHGSRELGRALIPATDLARAGGTLIRRKASLMSPFNSQLQHN